MSVQMEEFGERKHSVADIMVLLAAVCVALVTWSSLTDVARVPLWKSYIGVVISLLFALAALTRHPRWAASIRFLTGVWMVTAPFLLKFTDTAPALWGYLTLGSLIISLSVPDLPLVPGGRARLVR